MRVLSPRQDVSAVESLNKNGELEALAVLLLVWNILCVKVEYTFDDIIN